MKRRLTACVMALCILLTTAFPMFAAMAEESLTYTPAPATETPAPAAETPAPATEAPATDVPATDVPATDVPATDAPATDVPATDAPATDVPATDVPATDAPATDAPATDAPASLTASLTSAAAYAFANRDTVMLTATLNGGAAPYSLTLTVNGEAIQTLTGIQPGAVQMTYAPTAAGTLTFEITATDALGATASAGCSVQAAVKQDEYEQNWKADFARVALTGDWRIDLIAIAETQLGYEESATDFVIDANGDKQGYTRYGEWYGSSYADWCAMFVSFCLNYAGVNANDFPREANAANWKEQLQWKYAYEDDEFGYDPQPGDLIFFNYEGTNEPQHVGIVADVNEYWVFTIEGNAEKAVRRKEYQKNDERIVGYANTAKLMDRAGKFGSEEIEAPAAGTIAYTTGTNVNLRSDATTNSDVVVKLEAEGTQLTVVGARMTGGAVWYQVTTGEHTGYIREDLLQLVAPEATTEAIAEATTEPTVEPTAEATTAEATTEPTGEPTPEWIVQWKAEREVSDEMIRRAMEAGSLEAMVLEDDKLIYVRTGEAVARLDKESGYLIDTATGLVVAAVDNEGRLIPIVSSDAE